VVATRSSRVREIGPFKSVELRFVMSDNEDEMIEGFFAAIEELERMVREPSVLNLKL